MKVLFHISAHFIGGAERQLQYLISYLPRFAKSGELDLFLTYESPAVVPLIEYLKVNATLVATRKELAAAMERIRPDIVQFYTSSLVYRSLSLLKFKPHVVEVIHNKNQFKGDATSYPKDRTDVIVCVSLDAQQFISSHFKSIDTLVIKNGVDGEFFTPKEEGRSRTPVVGYAGRLCKDKGIDTLIRLAPQFNCPLELVGQDFGKYRSKPHENVRIFDQTDAPESFYRSWWATVSASPHESFGMTIAESLACNTPVVMTPCGGIESYVKHGREVLIAESDRELVTYVNSVIAGNETLDPLHTSFSAEEMARNYLNLYKKLMGQTPRSRIVAPVTVIGPPQPNATARIFKPIQNGVVVYGGALGVTPRAWYGVIRSLAGYCDAHAEPDRAAQVILKMKPRVVVLGCYQDSWRDVLVAAKQVKAKVVATWHASYILNEFHGINRVWMAQMLDAYKAGRIDYLATPHEGLAKSWTHYGYKTDYFPNLVEESFQKVKKLPGVNIGILGSGQNWKNMECQIIAAGMIEGAHIHVQEVVSRDVISRLGIEVTMHPKTLSDQDYYKLVGGMSVNLCVSLSEVYSYLTAESFLMNTPVVTSSITPLIRGHGGRAALDMRAQLPFCSTPFFEDPMVIAELCRYWIKSSDVTDHHMLREYMLEVNEENRQICSRVVGGWA